MTNFVESEEEAKSTGIEPVFRKPGCIGERVRRAVLRAVKFIREDLRRATGFGRTSRFGGKQRVSRKCGNLKKLLDCGASVVEKGTLFLFTINKAL